MATYKQIFNKNGSINQNTIQRVEDGACIPNNPDNRDWIQYQEDIKQGTRIVPPDAIAIDPKEQAKNLAQQKLKDVLATDKEKLDALVTLNS